MDPAVFDSLLGIGRFVLATTFLLLLTVPTAFIVGQMELKIMAQMQLRYGPNRVGPWGMFQSAIHGFKMLAKEDQTPDRADVPTFTLAPWMVFMAAAMSMLVIPFAPGIVAIDSEIGVIYFFAIIGLSVVGMLIAGWASYNKWALLGGLRASSQMLSYEVAMGLSLMGVFLVMQTLEPGAMVLWQGPNPLHWGWAVQPVAFVLFLFLWFRATFPRYRYDQIMRLGWKVFNQTSVIGMNTF